MILMRFVFGLIRFGILDLCRLLRWVLLLFVLVVTRILCVLTFGLVRCGVCWIVIGRVWFGLLILLGLVILCRFLLGRRCRRLVARCRILGVDWKSLPRGGMWNGVSGRLFWRMRSGSGPLILWLRLLLGPIGLILLKGGRIVLLLWRIGSRCRGLVRL